MSNISSIGLIIPIDLNNSLHALFVIVLYLTAYCRFGDTIKCGNMICNPSLVKSLSDL